MGHALGRAADAHIVVENSYVNVTDGVVRRGDSEIRADGLFSLGYPRDDGGEEIDARFRVVRRDLDSLRHAFQIDDYPVSGLLSRRVPPDRRRTSGRSDSAAMTIDEGVAYGEPFQKATASLRFDGTGVRLDGIDIAKGGGAVTGAAFVGWDSTYSFNADRDAASRSSASRRSPIRARRSRASRSSPPAAAARSTCRATTSGSASTICSSARKASVRSTGTLALRGKELSGEIDVASPRLARHRHRPHRADAAGRRGAHVPLPRQLARSVRAPVRAEAVAVHDRRRQRVDPRRRRARRPRSPARRRHRRHARHAAVRLRGEERGADPAGARSQRRSRSRSCSWSATTRGCACPGPIGSERGTHRAAGRRARRTSASCRASSATCADRAARS